MIRRVLGTQFRRNVAAGPVSALLNTGVLFLGYPVYLRALGYDRYGVWLVLSTVLSFVQLTNLGVGPAVQRLVAAGHARSLRDDVESAVATSIALVVASGILACVILYACRGLVVSSFRLEGEHATEVLSLLPWIGVLSVYAFVVQTYTATLAGLGRMDLSSYADTIGRAAGFIASVTMLWAGAGVVSLLVGGFVSQCLTHLVSAWSIRATASLRLWRISSISGSRAREVLSMAGPLLGSSAVALLLHPFNRFAVARWGGVAAVPVYEIGFGAAMQLRGLADAALRAISPEVSRKVAENSVAGMAGARRLVRQALMGILQFGGPAWLLAGVIAPTAMRVWLQARFNPDIATAFQVLLVGSYLGLLGAPAYYLLLGLGRASKILMANLVQSGVNVLGVLVLVAAGLSIDGRLAAVAAAIGMVSGNIYLMASLRSVDRTVEPRGDLA